MTSLRRSILFLAALGMVFSVSWTTPSRAAAVAPPGANTDPITIDSVTPWVLSEGEFQVRFTTSATFPADAQLSYTIHQPLTASTRADPREALIDVLGGGSPGKVLQAPVTTPLSQFGTAEGSSLLSIPVRSRSSSDRGRAFLPNPGIHPISIVITSAGGPELWSTVVFLNHLPRDYSPDGGDRIEGDGTSDGSAAPSEKSRPNLVASLVVPVSTRPAMVSGKAAFGVRDTARLSALTRLLKGAPSSPLKVLLRGDVIAGLNQMDDRWSASTLEALQTAFGATTDNDANPTPDSTVPDSTTPDTTVAGASTTGTVAPSSTSPGTSNGSTSTTAESASTTTQPNSPNGGAGSSTSTTQTGPELVAAPFVGSDTEALATAGAGDVMRSQLDLGSELAAATSTRPLLRGAWMLDDHLGPVAAPMIESLGVSEVVVGQSQISRDDRGRGHLSRLEPGRLGGTSSTRVIAYDKEISTVLAEDTTTPVLRAHEVLSLLFADWYDNSTERDPVPDPVTVIVVQPTASPETVAAIGSALSGVGPVRGSSADHLFVEAGSVSVEPDEAVDRSAEVTLRAPSPTDNAIKTLAEFSATGTTISSFATATTAEPMLESWRLRNSESLAATLSNAQVSSIHRSIRSQISERTSAIRPPESRRIILGGRETTIPLRFRNDLPYTVTVRLHGRSPRLKVGGGNPIDVVLKPGENRVDVPIAVQAPGESLLRMRVTTPDELLPISSFDLPVQSTAISGVGAALSIISILFLMVWWARTFLRGRRDEARKATAHPSVKGSD